MKINRIIIFGVLLPLFTNIVNAANMYISPDDIRLTNVLIGGYAEKIITITTDSEVPLEFELSAAGQIKDWIGFSPNTSLKVSKASPLHLKVMVKPPKTAAEGTYSGSLKIYFEQKQLGTTSENLFELKISMGITDKIVKQAIVKNIFVKDTEKDHLIDFFIDIANTGNIEVKPTAKVEIEGKSNIYEEVLLPFEEKEIVISLGNDLDIGNYIAKIAVLLDNVPIIDKFLPFNILEKNSLIRKGTLLYIKNEERIHVNDKVRVDSLFKNTGEISVYTKFKGKIYFDDIIIQEIESEELYAPVNKTITLTSYFVPEKIGLYKIVGQVIYSTTITEEKESIVDVRPKSESLEIIPLAINLWVIFFLIILFLGITNIVLRKNITKEKG